MKLKAFLHLAPGFKEDTSAIKKVPVRLLNKQVGSLRLEEVRTIAALFDMEFHDVVVEMTCQRCRVCGCTQFDCSQCIEKTGSPCSWVEDDLCSACE